MRLRHRKVPFRHSALAFRYTSALVRIVCLEPFAYEECELPHIEPVIICLMTAALDTATDFGDQKVGQVYTKPQ